jgi:hypothetical protein
MSTSEERRQILEDVEREIIAPRREVGTWSNLIIFGIWTAVWAALACLKVGIVLRLIEYGDGDRYEFAAFFALLAMDLAILFWSVRELRVIWSLFRLTRSFDELKRLPHFRD